MDIQERIWDSIVDIVVKGGGFEGFDEQVQNVMADMHVEDILEMSWETLIDKVEEELGE